MVEKGKEYSVKLRQNVRNFLVRDFDWKVVWMGSYCDIFVNQYKAVIIVVQYHIEKKLAVAVVRSDEFDIVRSSTIFDNIDDFKNKVSDYL